jgi:hypothetical protein
MQREINKLENEALFKIAEEITPYATEHMHNLVTILDEQDLKA